MARKTLFGNTSKPRKRRTPTHIQPAPLSAALILARRLDMLAGCELHHGHHDAAEHLSRRAAALRGWA